MLTKEYIAKICKKTTGHRAETYLEASSGSVKVSLFKSLSPGKGPQWWQINRIVFSKLLFSKFETTKGAQCFYLILWRQSKAFVVNCCLDEWCDPWTFFVVVIREPGFYLQIYAIIIHCIYMYILAKYIYSYTLQTDFLGKTEYDLT